jgi:NAD(P)-dependent dehydrogenase (short-subunit alcohol dehydrogenase family)
MELGLKGKVAIITGAGSQIGFGKAIAIGLAKEGCDVVVCDVDLAGANQTAAEVEKLGHKAVALKTDVTKWQDVSDMFNTAINKFGKVDILVNNAGYCTPPKPFLKMTDDEWNKDIAINLTGTMYCSRAVLPHMISRKSGKIVNITSGAGIHGGMFCNAYAAAKAGIIAFSKSLAKEVAPDQININLVAPGVANTGFARQAPPGMIERASKSVPLGRLTQPEDIANAVIFLCSDAASDIVGQVVPVTGSSDP